MATLALADQQRIWRGLMRWLSRKHEPCNVVKADLLAAVQAADGWVDSNATSYNNAIPQPARNNLTASQKALILALVVLARYDVAALRQLAGEVD